MASTSRVCDEFSGRPVKSWPAVVADISTITRLPNFPNTLTTRPPAA
jgi:hypothetical protein